ncbi:GntR family transcriptional regulator [Caulobacter sp. S45]|uniref:GntR family transcriptional regulator n=1 Tax=Caulobacter sp. S45 TaxID=1641861 RepID=UPI00131D204C|nr:GntR family transcriptional regulator [Caulobacter sp. S45]
MSIVVRTISDQAYELMRERILTGSLPGGSPVRQDAIAGELGVSKIPLREALSRLEQDGLLSSFPNRGFVVRSLSAGEAEEVYQLRLKIEPDAAADACLKVSEADHVAAREALTMLERELERGGGDHMFLNRAFHMAIIRPGVGLVTSQIVERLNVLAERYVRVHLEPVGRDLRANAEHRELLNAWIARDPDLVRTLLSDHIRATLHDVREQLAV